METGTVVVETEGYFKGCEFVLTGEFIGTHEKWGERKLIAPVVPIAPKKSLGIRLLEGEPLPTLSEEETPTFNELLPRWDMIESVRVLAPGRLEGAAKALFDRLGILYPYDWRGTEHGKRKRDAQEQRTLAATIKLKDGRSFNNLSITLRLLSEGKEDGWKITKRV